MKKILLATAILLSASSAFAQDARPTPADTASAPVASTISPGEIAWGDKMNDCFKSHNAGDVCYVTEKQGHLLGHCDKSTDALKALVVQCSTDSNKALQPKRWVKQ